MGYKKNDPCLQKAFDDERLFVLMTRDSSSPRLVMEWIKENLNKQPKEKLREAFECALEMQDRHDEMCHRKHLEKNEGWISVHHKLPDGRYSCDVRLANFPGNATADFYPFENRWVNRANPHHKLDVEFWKNPVPIEIPFDEDNE